MDIVYVYKQGWGNGLELKYSLRSLVNFPHDNVYIVGDKPDWIKGVIHIPASDEGNKFENVRNKFMAICKNNDISNDFVLMHDDFYILQPIDSIPYYIRGTLQEHMDTIYSKYGENHYRKSIKGVKDKFPDGLSFDVHTPIVLNREKFKKILELYPGESGSKRSLYCNYYGIEGVKGDTDDCKVYMMDRKYNKWKGFLSSNDDAIKNLMFMKHINTKFPNKCKYEI